MIEFLSSIKIIEVAVGEIISPLLKGVAIWLLELGRFQPWRFQPGRFEPPTFRLASLTTARQFPFLFINLCLFIFY